MIGDCWIIIHNKVYNITEWIPNHPGGEIIMAVCYYLLSSHTNHHVITLATLVITSSRPRIRNTNDVFRFFRHHDVIPRNL